MTDIFLDFWVEGSNDWYNISSNTFCIKISYVFILYIWIFSFSEVFHTLLWFFFFFNIFADIFLTYIAPNIFLHDIIKY